MKLLWTLLLALVCITPLSAQPEPTHVSPRAEELNDGYSLLYGLADKEKDAHLVFIFKDATPSTQDTVKEISNLFSRIDRELPIWDRHDNTIDLKINHLPKMETMTRDEIEKSHRHDLFALKSPAFDHYFLILQYESVTYALNLIVELRRLETIDTRRKTLLGWEHELRQLEAQILDAIVH